MKTTKRCICVWLDTNSDDWAWIVSLDEIDDRGHAESTHTLRSYEIEVDEDGDIDQSSSDEEEEKAWQYARAASAKRGLPLYANPPNGPAVLVADAPGQ